MKNKIKDFGNYIPGSRAELWGSRRFYENEIIEMLEGMTNDQMKKVVSKNSLFPRIDYKELVNEGYDKTALFWMKSVRDAIPSRPKNYTPYDIMLYTNFVVSLKEVVLTAKSREDIIPLEVSEEQYDAIYDNLQRVTNYRERSKFYQLLDLHDDDWARLTKKRIDSRFLTTPDEIVERSTHTGVCLPEECSYYLYKEKRYFKVRYSYGWRGLEDIGCHNGKYFAFIISNAKEFDSKIIACDFESKEEALLACENHLASLKQNFETTKKVIAKRKAKLAPPQLEHVKRINAKDWIGHHTISGEDYLNEFKLYGGQFGNWMSQKDRRYSLNYGYEALKDLATVLDIEDSDISFNGKLSIAWGARGHGSALAHYEPDEEVINLTKEKGAGSLAHEWAHALDYIIGDKVCGYKLTHSRSPYRYVIDAMKYKVVNGSSVFTDFYRDAMALDGQYSRPDKGYWASEVEMFARCFACYVHDKLAEDGNRNDYLCGHAYLSMGMDPQGKVLYSFPRNEEKENINNAIEKMLIDLKEKEFLHKRVEKEEQQSSLYDTFEFQDFTGFVQCSLFPTI